MAIDTSDMISLKDAQELLDIGDRMLRVEIRNLKIDPVRSGIHAFIRREDVDRIKADRQKRKEVLALKRALPPEKKPAERHILYGAPVWITRKEARECSGLTLGVIQWLIDTGRLKAIKDRHIKVRRVDVEALPNEVIFLRCPEYRRVLAPPVSTAAVG